MSGPDLRAIQRFLEFAHDLSVKLPRPVLQALEALIPADLMESFQMQRGVSGGQSVTDRDEVEQPPGLQQG